jgi:predicted branched-subunit amino acid permease
VSYFFGYATPICPPWYVATWLGAVIGSAIPAELGLDFIVPIAFIAIIAPMLRTRAHKIAAVTATVCALCLVWLPYNLGLMVSGIVGMMAGAQAERLAERKAAA